MRILLAEDNQSIATLLCTILEQEGHTVIVADNGLEALQQALMHRPDVAVLDGSMPVLDGWEVCRRIKAQIALPILMLTVHAEQQDRDRSIASGADAFMAKPFDIHEFVAVLATILPKK